MKSAEELTNYLNAQFDEQTIELHAPEHGSPWISLPAEAVRKVGKFLRDDPECAFDALMCLSGLHYKDEEELGVAYHLHSTTHGHSLAMKVRVPESDPRLPSVESVWKTADWHEREAYDMVGVIFDDHPNLQRILCPDDWEGFPLRKDYEPQEFYHNMTTGE